MNKDYALLFPRMETEEYIPDEFSEPEVAEKISESADQEEDLHMSIAEYYSLGRKYDKGMMLYDRLTMVYEHIETYGITPSSYNLINCAFFNADESLSEADAEKALENTSAEAMMESFKDMIDDIWAWIKRMVRKLIDFVKTLFSKLTMNVQKLREDLEGARKLLKQSKFDKGSFSLRAMSYVNDKPTDIEVINPKFLADKVKQLTDSYKKVSSYNSRVFGIIDKTSFGSALRSIAARMGHPIQTIKQAIWGVDLDKASAEAKQFFDQLYESVKTYSNVDFKGVPYLRGNSIKSGIAGQYIDIGIQCCDSCDKISEVLKKTKEMAEKMDKEMNSIPSELNAGGEGNRKYKQLCRNVAARYIAMMQACEKCNTAIMTGLYTLGKKSLKSVRSMLTELYKTPTGL